MADKPEQPELHILAGPNGAGKSTLYHNRIAPEHPNAPFVNPDIQAHQKYGRPPETDAEFMSAARESVKQRRELMSQGSSFVMESTFASHAQVDLIRQAQQAGYSVSLYHVNVDNPEMSRERVNARVTSGGHGVPDELIEQRYHRSLENLREAVSIADRTEVYDNSRVDSPLRQTLQLNAGQVTWAQEPLPAWARTVYQEPLEADAKAREARRGFSDRSPGPNRDAAAAWLSDPAQARQDHPGLSDEMDKASALMTQASRQATRAGYQPRNQEALVNAVAQRAADQLERGEPLADVREHQPAHIETERDGRSPGDS